MWEIKVERIKDTGLILLLELSIADPELVLSVSGFIFLTLLFGTWIKILRYLWMWIITWLHEFAINFHRQQSSIILCSQIDILYIYKFWRTINRICWCCQKFWFSWIKRGFTVKKMGPAWKKYNILWGWHVD